MNSFKQLCIDLRKQGHTLGEIVRITGRPKTSVYVHIQNLPLTPEKWKAIRAAHGERIRKFAIARRGKSSRSFTAFSIWNAEYVLLVSHLLFDGEIKPFGCSYNNRNEALVNRVESLMRHIYYFKPRRYYNSRTGVYRISYFNVSLGSFMRERAIELLKEIVGMSIDLKRAFIRAFFDDEGCMDFRPHNNARKIRGYQKNVEILELIQKLFLDFGIVSRIVMPNEIVIVGKENFLKFQKEIDFSPGVYINGNRSNSIWKKSLEKRGLLASAIASYKPVGSNGVHRGR